jgi:hypothetical protein
MKFLFMKGLLRRWQSNNLYSQKFDNTMSWRYIFLSYPNLITASRTWSCGGPYKINTRIVGGQPVTPHSIPFQVGLVRARVGSKPFCGGSLISPTFVLTAAHCTHQSNASGIDVLVGEHNFEVKTLGALW